MDLTPCQFLKVRDCLKANPDASAAALAVRTGLPRELIDVALRMLSK